jgi:putative transposase
VLQKGNKIIKGNMVQDHVHMLIEMPPKYSVSEIIGYINGKSAIAVARQFSGRQRNFNGEQFWARGYAVSTVGFELAQIHSIGSFDANKRFCQRTTRDRVFLSN